MDVIEQRGETGSRDIESATAGAPPTRILLVDDHADTLLVIRSILEQRGYEVLPAASLSQAYAQAESGFDLLLCDIDLPDGSGLDLIAGLSATRSIRAIAMSGYGAAADIERSVAAGFMRHLVKPFTIDRLLEAIVLALT
jgi:CheY-like chemotaxis protein